MCFDDFRNHPQKDNAAWERRGEPLPMDAQNDLIAFILLLRTINSLTALHNSKSVTKSVIA